MTVSHLAAAAAAGYVTGLVAAAVAFFAYYKRP